MRKTLLLPDVHFVRKLMNDVQYKCENNRNYIFLKKNLNS